MRLGGSYQPDHARQNLVDFVTRIFYKYASSKIAHDHRFDVRFAVGATRDIEVALHRKTQRRPSACDGASGPIPKFVSVRVTFRYELRNQRTTSNFMILMRL